MDNDNRKQMRNLHEKNRSKSRTKSQDFEEVATFMLSNPKVLENMLRQHTSSSEIDSMSNDQSFHHNKDSKPGKFLPYRNNSKPLTTGLNSSNQDNMSEPEHTLQQKRHPLDARIAMKNNLLAHQNQSQPTSNQKSRLTTAS